jgi:CHRD domain
MNNTTKRLLRVAVASTCLFQLVPGVSQADQPNFQANLSGLEEVHGPNLGVGAIFSTGSGRITLHVDPMRREIDYELTYQFPDAGTTPVVGAQYVNQAHLHFGQRHTTGGITVWLCQSADTPAPAAVAADTPNCPSPSGTVTGTIRPQHVLGLAGQGLPGGEDGFDALLKALRDKAIYANVHTDRFAAGEIRAQVGR